MTRARCPPLAVEYADTGQDAYEPVSRGLTLLVRREPFWSTSASAVAPTPLRARLGRGRLPGRRVVEAAPELGEELQLGLGEL